ncbi:Type IV fimbrial assembly protein PilC [hydrothermal vent metagenome]|uniref:Type IV fimbrial assembly protein PilC n=1 Tax=hydrothermal vent metagenome TaxID=652676 RepID=A0A3B1CMV6_9ZZZZ
MAAFRFVARDMNGNVSTGVMEGSTSEEIARILVTSGLYPSRITPSRPKGFGEYLRGFKLFSRSVTAEERITLTERFATLLKAGVPINSCLEGLIEQTDDGPMRRALIGIKKRVEEGAMLSEAMAGDRAVFPEVYTAVVAAGEHSGSLDTCLQRIAKLLEWEREVKLRAKEILRYPKILLGALAFAITIAFAFIIPKYVAIFEQIEMPLPLPTRIMIGTSHIVERAWGVTAVMGGVAIIFWARWIKTEKGRLAFDKLILKTWLTGDILTIVYTAGWANVLGNLIRAGVPIIQALTIAARTVGNRHYALMAKMVIEDVKEGAGISQPVRRIGFAPAPSAQMIAAGEESGALDEMLFRLGEYFEKEADRKIKTIGAIVEPALIVVFSFLVLGLALAIFMPMWEMTGLAARG